MMFVQKEIQKLITKQNPMHMKISVGILRGKN